MTFPYDAGFLPDTVYLIGAGSGDIKYLTIEAHSLLQKADIILHDMSMEGLQKYYPNAAWQSVGKRKGRHIKRQSEINELLLDLISQGKKVVRLKAGDVSFYARSSEEIEFLRAKGFNVKLVMGISSPQLLAEALGESITHRDITRSISFSSGYWDKDIERKEIPKTDAHFIFMGLAELKRIVKDLLDSGKPEDTSFIVASNLGRVNQKILKTTLKNAIADTEKANIDNPALIAVGLNHI